MEKIRTLYIPALVMLAFSYPLTSVLLTIGELPVATFNILIKAVTIVLFLFSVVGSLLRKRVVFPPAIVPFLIFFSIIFNS